MNNRIQAVIKAVGLKKVEFAKRIRLSAPYISELCSGKTCPSDRTISDICREFNISEVWLRTGEGEMFTHVQEATVDRLAREYGLDDLGRQIMAAYLKLDESDRLSVGRLIHNIIGERPTPAQEVEAPADTRTREEKPVTEWTEADIDAEVEDYRRQLLEEKRQAASGSASSDTSTSGTA